MYYNSSSFLWFFPLVVAFYFVLPKKVKPFWLLISNCYFYFCFSVPSLILLVAVTLFSYAIALLIEKSKKGIGKKLLLLLGIITCLGGLVATKYLQFFSTAFSGIMEAFGGAPTPVVSNFFLVGSVSFYTFQALGYVIDVYKEKYPAEKNFLYYALFVSFFPTIAMGPIQRANVLIPQLKEPCTFEYNRVADGLFTMLFGFFKKLVLADGLAVMVNNVYRTPRSFEGPALILAVFAFSIQIYCDFSGYSDISIGVAKVLGFNLAPNFKLPYFASSIGDFWNRWHISLSTWFRDYVYIPLGGNRKGMLRTYINLLITFLVSGLWHGASWNFVVWGGLHGLFSVVERLTATLRQKLKKFFFIEKIPVIPKLICTIFTFLLVTAAWVFFRAETFDDAVYILTHLHTGFSSVQLPTLESIARATHLFITTQAPFSYNLPNYWEAAFAGTGFFANNKGPDLLLCLPLLFIFSMWEAVSSNKEKPLLANCVRSKPFFVRWPIYYVLGFLILVLGNFGSSAFIYAQY
jgi:Predicted membrane protein involved in D-alanine export